jgi:hypothetical protein
MRHSFRITTSRFSAERDLARWLHESLSAAIEEAEVATPVQDESAWTIWLDYGGDRHRVAVARDGAIEAATWCIKLTHQEPFVRAARRHARSHARFDGLVATIRTILLTPFDIGLIAESDD